MVWALQAICLHQSVLLFRLTTYKATGPFTLVDDAMPDGAHYMWPNLGAKQSGDPKLMAASMNPWEARVTLHFEASGANVHARCDAGGSVVRAPIGLSIDLNAPTYTLTVMNMPKPELKCDPPGTLQSEAPWGPPADDFLFTSPRGAPGKLSGTRAFTKGNYTAKVTYEMEPAK